MDALIFEKTYYNTRQPKDKTFQPMKTTNYLVYQIGETYYLYGGNIPRHKQAFMFEFTFIESGNALIYKNETPYTVKKGDIFISLKDEYHRIEAKDSFRFSYFAVDIRPGSIYYKFGQKLFKKFNNAKINYIYQPQLFYLMSNMLTENLHPDKFSKRLIDNYITHFLVNLYRGHIFAYSSFKDNDMLVYEIIKDIDKNFILYTSIEMIANKYGYNPSSLSVIFKKTTKQSLKNYLTKIRFDYAKQLLNSGKKVMEVANILGYSSPYNFSRAYKIIFGSSPNNEKNKN